MDDKVEFKQSTGKVITLTVVMTLIFGGIYGVATDKSKNSGVITTTANNSKSSNYANNNANKLLATPIPQTVDNKTGVNKRITNGEAANLGTSNTPSDDSNNSSVCKIGVFGYFKRGNLLTTPRYSAKGNKIAFIQEKAKVKILEVTEGEANESTGNTVWYKVQILSGTCYYDKDSLFYPAPCKIEDLLNGYVSADLVEDCK